MRIFAFFFAHPPRVCMYTRYSQLARSLDKVVLGSLDLYMCECQELLQSQILGECINQQSMLAPLFFYLGLLVHILATARPEDLHRTNKVNGSQSPFRTKNFVSMQGSPTQAAHPITTITSGMLIFHFMDDFGFESIRISYYRRGITIKREIIL